MDQNEIKKRLEAFEQKKEKKEKVDTKKFFWKPTTGKQVVRIVPSKENPKYPFKEVFVHYGVNKFPMLALTNWGEKDPIVEFANDLKKKNNKEDWALGKKLSPKMRVFVPVIVRGEEELGTRLWEFGKEIYQELLKLAEDEEVGDYTSITNGRDITVETISKEVTGNFARSSIRVKINQSPLLTESATKEQIQNILNNQPSILNIYERISYEKMKDILQEFLNPSEESEVVVSESTTTNGKTSKVEQFQDLFEK